MHCQRLKVRLDMRTMCRVLWLQNKQVARTIAVRRDMVAKQNERLTVLQTNLIEH